jgi:hypothetical protein
MIGSSKDATHKIRRSKKCGREEKLKAQSTAEEIQAYQKNWREHVERM